jgi:hypothetical protein
VRQRRPLRDDFLGPDLHVRADDGERADRCAVGQDALFADDRALADRDGARTYRLAHTRAAADHAALPQHDVPEGRSGAEPRAIADDDVLERDAGVDARATPDDDCAAQTDVLGDHRIGGAPDSRLATVAPFAAQLHGHAALQDVGVRAPILVEIADIAPVAGCDMTEQARAVSQHARVEILREVEVGADRHAFERLGFEHVDARVDRVAEDLAPRRLLEEPLDPTRLRVRDDDAEGERVLDRRQGDRGLRAPRAVGRDRGRQIEVRQHVTTDHEDRLTRDQVRRIPDRARRAVIRVSGHVLHAHPEVGAVPEVLCDVLGLEVEDRDEVRDPVPSQEVNGIGHDRPVRYRDHRLRPLDREWFQAGAEPASHDDSLHRDASVRRLREETAQRPVASDKANAVRRRIGSTYAGGERAASDGRA